MWRLGRISRSSVYSAVGVSTLFATYVGWQFSRNLVPSEELFPLYRFVLTTLLATWLVADARETGRTRPTFDYGAYAFFAFILFAPYYLISTRRWRGALILVGISLLFLLPALVSWAVAAYVS